MLLIKRYQPLIHGPNEKIKTTPIKYHAGANFPQLIFFTSLQNNVNALRPEANATHNVKLINFLYIHMEKKLSRNLAQANNALFQMILTWRSFKWK